MLLFWLTDTIRLSNELKRINLKIYNQFDSKHLVKVEEQNNLKLAFVVFLLKKTYEHPSVLRY